MEPPMTGAIEPFVPRVLARGAVERCSSSALAETECTAVNVAFASAVLRLPSNVTQENFVRRISLLIDCHSTFAEFLVRCVI